MIVKQGFVRSYDGKWYSLDLFDSFNTRAIWHEDCHKPTFEIVGYWKNDEEQEDFVEFSEEYDDLHEAQCALDDAFGYTG